MLDPVFAAIETLQKTSQKKRSNKEIKDTIDAVASTLQSLKSPDILPESKIFDKLISTARGPLPRLYAAFPLKALELSAAIFSSVFDERVLSQLTAGNKPLQARWEKVAESVLSGVLDFLEAQNNATAFEAIASAMYPSLCRICFSPAFASSIASEATGLKETALMLLSDSADHMANRVKLWDPKLLGGQRIGSALYGSKEYLVIENLLLLILRLISLSTPKAKNERASFIHDIFTPYPLEGSNCGTELAQLFLRPSKIESDLIISRAFDILAMNNVLYPQPFVVNTIKVCNIIFPQKPPHERLIVDYRSFVASIPEGEGYETFRVPFGTVNKVTITPCSNPIFFRISIQTISPPQLGASSVKCSTGQPIITTFDILKNDAERFTRALDARSLTKMVRRSNSQKSQPRLAIGHTTPLVFGSDGNSIPDVPSYKEKVTNIGRAMELDNPNDDSPKTPDCLPEKSPQPRMPPAPAITVNDHSTAAAQLSLAINSSSDPLLGPSTPSKPKLKNMLVEATATPTAIQFKTLPTIPPKFSPIKIAGKSVLCTGFELSEISDDVDSLKSLSQRRQNKKNDPQWKSMNTAKAAVAIDARRRRIIDSDNGEVFQDNQNGLSNKSRRSAPQVGSTEEGPEISPNIELTSKPEPKAKERPGLTVSLQTQQSLGRIESVSPVSSPVDQPNDDFEDTDTKKSHRKPIPIKSRKPPTRIKRNTEPRLAQAARISTKRRRNEDGLADEQASNSAEDLPKTKRLRGKNLEENKQDDAENRSIKKSLVQKNKNYGNRAKKTKASPPGTGLLHSSLNVDYDEVPTNSGHEESFIPPKHLAKSLNTGKVTSMVTTRTRAAAMKNKKKELGSTTAKAMVVETSLTTNVTTVPVALDKRALANQAEPNSGHCLPATIALSRAPDADSKQLSDKSQVLSDNRSSQKHKKAPWETADFLKTLQPASDPDLDLTTFTPEPVDFLMKEAVVTVTPTAADKKQHSGASEPVPDISMQVFVSPEQKSVASKSPKLVAYQSLGNSGLGSRIVVELSNTAMTPGNSSVASKEGVDKDIIEVNQDVERLGTESGAEAESVKKIFCGKSIKMSSPVSTGRDLGSQDDLGRTKVNIPPAGVTMIDLTRDESPPKLPYSRFRGSTVVSSLPKAKKRVAVGILPQNVKEPISVDKCDKKSTPRTINKVKFVPTVKEMNDFMGGTKNLFSMTRSKFNNAGVGRQTVRSFVQDTLEQDVNIQEDPIVYDSSGRNIQGIVDVLDEIQEVMIQKISGRFGQVEHGARIRKSRLLQMAVSDLQFMHTESARHFNGLIDLETEYAGRGRKLAGAYEENVGINRDICRYLREKIQEHDRKTLVNKMPKTLTARPLPDIVQKYRSENGAAV